MTHTIKNEHYTAVFSDTGAEMISLKSPTGFEFLWQKQKDYWHMQAPLLFPLCGSFPDSKYSFDGKEYNMEMHGLALSSKFSLTGKSDKAIEFTLKSNELTREHYPFDFTIVARYELDGEKISFCFTVTNNSDKKMPYMFGWHPGFNLPTSEGLDVEDYILDFGSLKSLTWCPYIDEEFITSRTVDYPLQDGKFNIDEKQILENDTLIFTNHENRVKLYAAGHSYLLNMEWSENLPTLCFWKQETHEAKMLCVEPWCYFYEDGVTNANYNLRKMPSLMPGESEEYNITFTVKE